MNTAERVCVFVQHWADVYTRRLPYQVGVDRRAELASDLWEQRTDGIARGASPVVVATAIVRRMIAGIPGDLSWRRSELSAAHGGHKDRIDGRLAMVHSPMPLTRTRRRLTTRRCKACGERYRRKLPYCPVCKVRPGQDGVPRDPKWAGPVGFF